MARTDERIKKDVVDELYWDDRVNASEVYVEVSNGTVTLRGEVPTYFSKTAAHDDALEILGVVSVRNQF
ncbi:MAG: BON domain-containing protein [Thermodesulfobacteriota bacterium]